MEGRSLLPVVHGTGRGPERGPRQGVGQGSGAGAALEATNEWPDEVYVQISEAQVGRAVRTRRWKYGVDAPGRSGGTDPTADAYVEQYLYDLWADPYELNNLCGLASHREVSDVLKSRLKRLMTAAGESEPEISNAPERPSGQKRVSAEEARL
jgi:arylsulfatase A-like enzyme